MTLLWIACCLGLAAALPAKDPPEFGDLYHVSGIIYLPYSEIEEPFEAWYNATGKESRIDYYNGQVKTFQHAFELQYGIGYKISPETTETEFNVIKCFQVNGTKTTPIYSQPIFPDTSSFKFVGMDHLKGRKCELWRNVTYGGGRKQTFSLWVTDDGDGVEPLRYEMIGVDTLLDSHFDKYYIDYDNFRKDVDPAHFHKPKGMKCVGFPGPGVEHHLLLNPIAELMHKPAHMHGLFNHFKRQHGRTYMGHENEDRRDAFVHNVRFIHSTNRAQSSFRVGMNHLTDYLRNEVQSILGHKPSPGPNGGLPFPAKLYAGVEPPENLDWRLYGAVTPVKDQAICGSCWSFASTGTLEGALFLKTGKLVKLSQQMLMDCTWGFGNNGCDGGEEWRGYEWIKRHGGICTAESYGSYMGENGFCHYNSSEQVAQIENYVNVTSGDAQALRIALFKHGPTAVSMDAMQRSFTFYENGIYYEPKCKNKAEEMNHAVLAVGYGVLQGKPYWLVKNSWSTYWGNAGYFLISTKDNNCGITSDATFVVLK
uniref:Zgc:110239 n=1 Tax=Eptatretus burgeri TaxID=7764 RepID=A0A8C4N3G8_EPTBU